MGNGASQIPARSESMKAEATMMNAFMERRTREMRLKKELLMRR